MATVTSSKRHLVLTSDTYTSNGDVVVGGDLTIQGTTTTLDTANLLVEDKNIIIGNVSSPSDTTADGGGITLKGASDYTINWSNANNRWNFNQGIHSSGNITGSNLSGTNTGDQDLSGYATTGSIPTDFVSAANGGTFDGSVRFDGGVNIDTNTNTNTLNVSRHGSVANEVMKIGVTDTVAVFNYIEDTSNEGNGNFGQYQFKLGGNDGEITVTGLTITKTGISAPNLSGTNTGDQVLPTDFVSKANGGTFSGDVTINGDLFLGNTAQDPKNVVISQIAADNSETTSLMLDGNGVVVTRNLGSGAFASTPTDFVSKANGGDFSGKLGIKTGQVWDATTQGTVTGSLHIDPELSTDHAGGAITFGASDASNGENAQAGIYIRSDGNYGTRMYFSTTDSYATGSKTAMYINHDKDVYFLDNINVAGDITVSGTVDGVDISALPTSFAPTNAEANVQADWNATSGDAQILNKLNRHFKSDHWGDDRFVRVVGGAGADTGDKWVHLSNVDITAAYEKIKIEFTTGSYDDNTVGQEKITVLYENGSSAQENHQLRWYAGDQFPDTFKAVKSIRSSSSGLTNTYDLYVQISGDWRDNFTVHAEWWKTHAGSTDITYPTTAGSTSTPTAGSDDKSLTSRQRWVDADKLDGQIGSHYLDYGNFTSTPTIPTNYLTNNAFDTGVGLYLTGGSYNAGTDTATTPLVIDEGDFIKTKDGNYLRNLIGKTTGDEIVIGQSGTSLIDSINFLPGGGGNSAVKINGNKIWNSGNDGSGSGLDADSLDGQHGSYYANLSTTQTISGAKNFTSGSNQFNGHLYYNAYDANGNHYPHFRAGSTASSGTTINFRQYYNATQYVNHVWKATSASNAYFDFVGEMRPNGLNSDGNIIAIGDIHVGSTTDTGSRRLLLHGSTANKLSVIKTTNGNLHIDSEDGHSLYLNYYEGASTNIYFGTGNGGYCGTVSSAGLLRMANDVVAYYSFSDRRLKTNIKTTENNLEKILSLNPVEYTWKEGPREGVKEIGLIAQEVEEVVPEVVRVQSRHHDEKSEGEDYKQVDYEHLVSTLIGAMQEQQNQIDELKSQMAACKERACNCKN